MDSDRSPATPTVSFVMPAWKGRFLERAVASVLSQTFRDFELVVADDASPDGIEGIVRGFADPRVRYFRNGENIGGRDLAAAWNAAMAHARGRFAVLASDDDEYRPEYLAEMMELAARFPSAGVYHCRVEYIDADGRTLGASEPRAPFESGAEFLYNRGVRRMKQCAPEFMFRTEDLRAAGGFFPSPRAWYSDDATWMTLARGRGAAYSPRPLFRWRDSGENVSAVFADVAEKLRAAAEFRPWIHGLIRSSPASAPGDAALLARADREIDYAIDHLAMWVFRNARLADAVRALWRLDRGPRLRLARGMSGAALRRAAEKLASALRRRRAVGGDLGLEVGD